MGKTNVELHFFFYKNKPENIEKLEKFQPKRLELLAFLQQNMLGPYPPKQYSVVSGGDGMEWNTMCALIGNRSYGSFSWCTAPFVITAGSQPHFSDR